MVVLKWLVLIIFILGTIFRFIGDSKESKKFGPFTIISSVLYSIGLIVCIICLICLLV